MYLQENGIPEDQLDVVHMLMVATMQKLKEIMPGNCQFGELPEAPESIQ